MSCLIVWWERKAGRQLRATGREASRTVPNPGANLHHHEASPGLDLRHGHSRQNPGLAIELDILHDSRGREPRGDAIVVVVAVVQIPPDIHHQVLMYSDCTAQATQAVAEASVARVVASKLACKPGQRHLNGSKVGVRKHETSSSACCLTRAGGQHRERRPCPGSCPQQPRSTACWHGCDRSSSHCEGHWPECVCARHRSLCQWWEQTRTPC